MLRIGSIFDAAEDAERRSVPHPGDLHDAPGWRLTPSRFRCDFCPEKIVPQQVADTYYVAYKQAKSCKEQRQSQSAAQFQQHIGRLYEKIADESQFGNKKVMKQINIQGAPSYILQTCSEPGRGGETVLIFSEESEHDQQSAVITNDTAEYIDQRREVFGEFQRQNTPPLEKSKGIVLQMKNALKNRMIIPPEKNLLSNNLFSEGKYAAAMFPKTKNWK